MKRIAAVMVLAVFCGACGAFAQSVSFTPKVEGTVLAQPVNAGSLATCIRLSCAKYGWVIKSDEPNVIVARYEKSNGLIFANIRIAYSNKGYSIEYVDSQNLDADLKNLTIHRNYVRWVNNLSKDISLNYMRTASN